MATFTSGSSLILESLYNHIAFPPRLPGRQEAKLDQLQHALVERLIAAAIILRDRQDQYREQWDSLRRSLYLCKLVNSGGKLNKSTLRTVFQQLQPNDTLILHVTEANAAVLIRRFKDATEESVLFEAFESSPLSEEVLAAKTGALEWDFPGSAIAVSYNTFQMASFQTELATFLCQASTESIKRFAARTSKAGSFAFESRDTVDPSLITSLLMAILEVNGTRKFPVLLRKRVRDQVEWTEGAEKPWRRCPLWLVLRVAIYRHLHFLLRGESARACYKFFMCQLLSSLSEELVQHHFHPELLSFLKTKLCRRLAKLETDRERTSPSMKEVYDYHFSILAAPFTGVIKNSEAYILAQWIDFKKRNLRPVFPLRRKANEQHFYLTLQNSGQYIQRVLEDYRHTRMASQMAKSSNHQGLGISLAIKQHGHAFASRYFLISQMEMDIETNSSYAPSSSTSCEELCIKAANMIEKYLATVGDAYESNAEQTSMMLLTVMELWCQMDQNATQLFGLLRGYNPGFPADIMDPLLIESMPHMRRLQEIRSYLEDRNTMSKTRMTIFNDPSSIRKLRAGAQEAFAKKEQEWQEKCLEYESLTKKISESSCLYEIDEFQNRIHLCFLERKAYRFRINVHEHPLPYDSWLAKSVVFELAAPKAFLAYREATWRIIGCLASSSTAPMDHREPRVLLSDYSQLQRFATRKSTFTLASTTKSFLDTHYRNPRFPVGLDDVCLPNGLKLGYFDSRLKSSPLSMLMFSQEFAMGTDGPSSYAIVASHTKCPSGVNVHEFLAYQTLFSGKARRWPQILIELGSSHLNFSTEATTRLIWHLALQVGPTFQNNPLGLVHTVFEDLSFCERLLEQLSQRLDSICTNFRETNCMETILTLTLRLINFGSRISMESTRLLEKARAITFTWITALRTEIQTATDAESSRKLSSYAFSAALLCRRTFAIYIDGSRQLDSAALHCYIESSITYQDHLVSDPAKLPTVLKAAFIRDLKMVYRMRDVLKQSLQSNPHGLITSITTLWHGVKDGSSRTFSQLKFLSGSEEWWVEVIVSPTTHTKEVSIHFHLLQGHLLVAGVPLGQLPAKYKTSVILERLFPNQTLLTYPSNLPGMDYALAIQMEEHQIHLAYRNGDVIVRALYRGCVLELIPYDKFGGGRNFDLPSSLVDGCFHWLDLNTGIIQIRNQPHIWRFKESNWALDFYERRAQRRAQRRWVTLIDPRSQLGKTVARMFEDFEYSFHITVFQHDRGTLSVELRRLELSFVVNKRYLLECQQLRAEIDPNQDCGTYYGLRSMIVMRHITQGWDSIPQRQRSIIVPLGAMSYKRHGMHVSIRLENVGAYAKFSINEVLGRLDCPAEPRLLYMKAQFHAYTSFVVPDTLTNRTGTEEALHILRSGCCQPWMPLTPGPISNLLCIAHLTPRRVYYPEDMKLMQKTIWDLELAATAQHDEFRAIVETILTKSQQLSQFYAGTTESNPDMDKPGDFHLTIRSLLRRKQYENPTVTLERQESGMDIQYTARDRLRNTQARANALECTSLIRNWPSKMASTANLAEMLQNWPTIKGDDGTIFGKVLLSDLLDVQFAAEWGPLVNLCRASSRDNSHHLMFLFATVAFRHDVDMEVIRTLISFAIFDELKTLHPPKWLSFSQFRSNQTPQVGYLQQLMKPSLIPYDGENISTLGFNLSAKQRRKYEAAETAYEQQQDQDTTSLARFLLTQWPSTEPALEGFSNAVLFDVTQAFEAIRPEWLRLFQNYELSEYVSRVQRVLDKHHVADLVEYGSVKIPEQEILPERCRGGEIPTLLQLVGKSGPTLYDKPFQSQSIGRVSAHPNNLSSRQIHSRKSAALKSAPVASELRELETIISHVQKSNSN
ncbi:hypothetical protein G7Y89_g5393 [Cudoniella acicularis]|uniref:ubiquitinyl hydrolase 1 n=1 Tax=Cudoniella acicularis TaxID=354080 RepID=A0A8H4RNY2_9HELO|nr:hypothetical protein G7Y89_g5393 [Cudoniella acicularis]